LEQGAVLRIVSIVSLLFTVVAHAGPARPAQFDRFAKAMVAWEALIDRAAKPHPADLTDREYQASYAIRHDEAVHVAHLLNPLLHSAEETYATGLYVLTGDGLESGLIRQLLRKALRHLNEHRNHEHILFYLTSMGGILKEWGLLDARMQVIPIELESPLTGEKAASTLTCVEKILEKRRE
jgi:hypothetical protein